MLLLHFHYLFHTIPYHSIATIDTKHQLVFCRTATVKCYFVHVLSNTHSLAEAETGALLCVSFPCRGEWRQQTRWWWWWSFTLFSVLCSQLSLCMAAAAAGRSDGWLYTSSYLCLELLVRAAFAIVVGVRASTVNSKFHSIRLATSRSELLHSAVVLSSICAQKTSGALPAIHPSRGSCQNLPCTTKVSRIPRGRVAHVLVDTQRESVCEWQYALNRSRVACDHQENLPESAQPLFSHVHVPPTCLRTPKNTQGHGQVCSCMQLLSSATAVRVS